MKCSDKAIELNSKNITTWINKGVALGKLNKNEEAIHCFKKALKLNPKFKEITTSAYINKEIILEKMNKYEKALECYNKVLNRILTTSMHCVLKELY